MVTVYKGDAEMEASDNPDGLAELAKSGWSTEKPKKRKRAVKADDDSTDDN